MKFVTRADGTHPGVALARFFTCFDSSDPRLGDWVYCPSFQPIYQLTTLAIGFPLHGGGAILSFFRTDCTNFGPFVGPYLQPFVGPYLKYGKYSIKCQ